MDALEQYDWPGNIRELQNVIERGVIMTNGPVLSPQTTRDLIRAEGATIGGPEPARPMSIKTLADADRAHITAILQETNWVVGGPRGAAAQLGVPRTTLLARMQRLGISGPPRVWAAPSTRRSVRLMGDPTRQPGQETRGLRAVGATAT